MFNHPFTQSGLGQAPFKAVTPGAELKAKNNAFFCEHCSRMLKNRFFVKSADGKLSVVGSECVKKADDDLYLEIKEIKKQQNKENKSKERQTVAQSKKEREKEALSGLTKEEAIKAAFAEKDDVLITLESNLEALDIFTYLSKSNYGLFVIEAAMKGQLPRPGAQAALIKKLTSSYAKKVKKGTPSHAAAESLANTHFYEFASLVESAREKTYNLDLFISNLTNTHY